MKILGDMFLPEGWRETEKGPECLLVTNPAHPVYQAHFPSYPVTPGVCLLQLAGELLSQRLRRPLYLEEVRNAKFLALLVPETGQQVCCRFLSVEPTETQCRCQLLICDNEKTFAKFSLTYRYE